MPYNEQGRKLCVGPTHDKPTWLAPTRFTKDESRSDGLSSICKTCYRYRRGIEQSPEEFLADKYPVDETPPDNWWWHFTGQEWLPRYGEEMLGEDF